MVQNKSRDLFSWSDDGVEQEVLEKLVKLDLHFQRSKTPEWTAGVNVEAMVSFKTVM